MMFEDSFLNHRHALACGRLWRDGKSKACRQQEVLYAVVTFVKRCAAIFWLSNFVCGVCCGAVVGAVVVLSTVYAQHETQR